MSITPATRAVLVWAIRNILHGIGFVALGSAVIFSGSTGLWLLCGTVDVDTVTMRQDGVPMVGTKTIATTATNLWTHLDRVPAVTSIIFGSPIAAMLLLMAIGLVVWIYDTIRQIEKAIIGIRALASFRDAQSTPAASETAAHPA